jgi:hypothetical protein
MIAYKKSRQGYQAWRDFYCSDGKEKASEEISVCLGFFFRKTV